jgi:hypothetical protein
LKRHTEGTALREMILIRLFSLSIRHMIRCDFFNTTVVKNDRTMVCSSRAVVYKSGLLLIFMKPHSSCFEEDSIRQSIPAAPEVQLWLFP